MGDTKSEALFSPTIDQPNCPSEKFPIFFSTTDLQNPYGV